MAATAKKTKTEKFNPLQKGADPRDKKENGKGEGKGMWLKLDPDTHVDVVCLVEPEEIITCEQCAIWKDDGNSPVWVYTGPEDPSHELKIDRRYKAYLPVLDEEGKPKVFGMGKQAHTQILEIADAVGEITGLTMRIKRTGAGLQTRYSVISKGKYKDVSSVDEVDVVALLGPITPEEVRDLIAEKLGYDTYEEVVAKYRGKKGMKKSGGKTEPVAPVQDDDDDELLEDDDDDDDDLDLD